MRKLLALKSKILLSPSCMRRQRALKQEVLHSPPPWVRKQPKN
jgi:hypothetical protein